ncbi:MAG TPA: Uma2 family endonuclease [Pirellulales bacterium]|jgi:Uma2 family endonuclease|nr:Uma2 family endonuclease [Pirellulales bacterium]
MGDRVFSTRPLPGTTRDPLYPDSDGEPVGETDYHVAAILHLFTALRQWYRLREDVYVVGDMLLYYEEGNPRACRGPDVMVCKGVQGKHPRRSFRTWEEGVAPAVIFEVTSRKTRHEDEDDKPLVYASLGVKELYLFDPEGEYLRPRLKGFQLAAGRYEPMATDADGKLFSPELGLGLAIDEHLLRLVDPSTGLLLPTDEEKDEELRRVVGEANEARREAELERQRSAMLEAELARLRASQPSDES